MEWVCAGEFAEYLLVVYWVGLVFVEQAGLDEVNV